MKRARFVELVCLDLFFWSFFKPSGLLTAHDLWLVTEECEHYTFSILYCTWYKISFWYSKLKAMRLFLTHYNHQPVELQCFMNANTSMWMWRFDCIDNGWYNSKYDLLIENKQVMTIKWKKKNNNNDNNNTAIEMESKSCKRGNTNLNKWQQNWFRTRNNTRYIRNVNAIHCYGCFWMFCIKS